MYTITDISEKIRPVSSLFVEDRMNKTVNYINLIVDSSILNVVEDQLGISTQYYRLKVE